MPAYQPPTARDEFDEVFFLEEDFSVSPSASPLNSVASRSNNDVQSSRSIRLAPSTPGTSTQTPTFISALSIDVETLISSSEARDILAPENINNYPSIVVSYAKVVHFAVSIGPWTMNNFRSREKLFARLCSRLCQSTPLIATAVKRPFRDAVKIFLHTMRFEYQTLIAELGRLAQKFFVDFQRGVISFPDGPALLSTTMPAGANLRHQQLFSKFAVDPAAVSFTETKSTDLFREIDMRVQEVRQLMSNIHKPRMNDPAAQFLGTLERQKCTDKQKRWINEVREWDCLPKIELLESGIVVLVEGSSRPTALEECLR